MKDKKGGERSGLVINHGTVIGGRRALRLERSSTFIGELVNKLKHLLDIVDLHEIRRRRGRVIGITLDVSISLFGQQLQLVTPSIDQLRKRLCELVAVLKQRSPVVRFVFSFTR